MRYRLVILDLDGTILFPDGIITPYVKKTVQRVLQKGILVTIATGRVFSVTQKFAQMLGIKMPLICSQGSVVKDPVTQQTLLYESLSIEQAHILIDFAETARIQLHLYQDDRVYADKETADLEVFGRLGPGDLLIVHNLKQFLKQDITKALFVCNQNNQGEIETALRKIMPSSLQVMRSHHHFLEVTSSQASKGKAAAFLANQYHILPSEVLAIGDHENDLDLIQWAGFGIAMDNGYDAVKACADWIAPSIENDGAAVALEKFILTPDAI